MSRPNRKANIGPKRPQRCSEIIFDVGANNGMTFMHRLEEGCTVYAFEPTPELAAKVRGNPDLMGRPNFHFTEAAVSDREGRATFHVAGHHDWGCSSLHPFSDGILDRWPDRPDFRSTHQVEVDVIRLDGFVRRHGIGRIDLLHIDAQGSDLEVIKSLGDEVGKVVRGVMEVDNGLSLYKDIPHRDECVAWLEANGFVVERLENNFGYGGSIRDLEQNIYFRNRNA